MLEYIKQEANMTLTENGAATFKSTGSEVMKTPWLLLTHPDQCTAI